MKRRTLLGSLAAGTVLAGCLGFGDDDDEESSDNQDDAAGGDPGGEEAAEALSQEEIVDIFEATLLQEGVEPLSMERVDDALEVIYHPGGTTAEDVAVEIAIFADLYVSAIQEGLATDRLVAMTYDPETEQQIDSFYIETRWAQEYLDEEIGWGEYRSLVEQTFDSAQASPDEGDAGENDAGEATDEDPQEAATDDGNDTQGGTDETAQDELDTEEEGGETEGEEETPDDEDVEIEEDEFDVEEDDFEMEEGGDDGEALEAEE